MIVVGEKHKKKYVYQNMVNKTFKCIDLCFCIWTSKRISRPKQQVQNSDNKADCYIFRIKAFQFCYNEIFIQMTFDKEKDASSN